MVGGVGPVDGDGGQGFEQTTTAQIAERADVTERTYFRHFADKREVLLDGGHELEAAVGAAITAAPDADDPLDAPSPTRCGPRSRPCGPRPGARLAVVPDTGTTTPFTADLPARVVLRLLHRDDGPALAAAYTRNREHLEPWEPARPEQFFEAAYHAERIPVELLAHGSGRGVPLVLERDGEVVGRVNLSDIVLGAFRNAHLGYWVDASLAGRGVMTAAVEAACAHARDDLGLHRVQAATLLHNAASQKVLARTGFERIGTAPSYLRIAGRWQDHALFQRILHDD